MSWILALARVLSIVFLLGLVGVSLLLGTSLGVGFVLNWMVPSIDFGMATICGLASITVVTATYIRLLRNVGVLPSMPYEFEDDDRSEMLSEEQVDNIADQLTEAVITRIAVYDGWNRPKTKSRR